MTADGDARGVGQSEPQLVMGNQMFSFFWSASSMAIFGFAELLVGFSGWQYPIAAIAAFVVGFWMVMSVLSAMNVRPPMGMFR